MLRPKRRADHEASNRLPRYRCANAPSKETGGSTKADAATPEKMYCPISVTIDLGIGSEDVFARATRLFNEVQANAAETNRLFEELEPLLPELRQRVVQ